MASLIDTLNASGGPESVGFLNDLIAQLWPNINVAGCRMVKETVEPMFATMLPGPLAGLHFTKLDLGPVPIKISQVDVIRTENGGVSLEMDVSWHSRSDFELDASIIPDLGIEHVHLSGRLSVLLAPLTNIIPCFGALQIAFINPPELKLDFTGAADIADSSLIDNTVRKIISDNIAAMAVLPNRFLYKLDANTDFFRTHLPHLGVLRLTVERASGLAPPQRSRGVAGKLSSLMSKVGIKDVPDCFCNVSVGAEKVFRTKTKDNSLGPVWDETHDFLVASYDQNLVIHVNDEDLGQDDAMGKAVISVKQLLLGGGSQELRLLREDLPDSEATVSVRAQFLHLVGDRHALIGVEASDDEIVGLATVLIGSVLDLQGERDDLKPSVKVSWGMHPAHCFSTSTKTYVPGTDIFNPIFDQAFRIPITKQMLENAPGFKIRVMNGRHEVGAAAVVPFEEVLNAESCVSEGELDVGDGVRVRARISVRGLQPAR